MQLSVLILSYNVRYFLQQCLQSVQRALDGIDAEIIVVDNASADDSCAMVKEKFPSVILMENKENTGFTKGNNCGVARAIGKYLCILNPDTVVAEDTFSRLLSFIQSREKIGMVGVKLIDGSGQFLPESKRGLPTPWAVFTRFSGLYKLFPQQFGQYYALSVGENETAPIAILPGAFLFMERSVFQEANGFDEACFMYADDIDLSYRLTQLGYTHYYYPETSVIHYKGESTRKDASYRKRLNQALHFFYQKHFRTHWLFNALMKVGITLFGVLRWIEITVSRKKPTRVPSQYYLMSSNQALHKKIETKLGKPIFLKDKEAIDELPPGSELIFDGSEISNCQVIALMERFKNRKCTFKIIPGGCSFMIGSNRKDRKGEFVIFD